jgi:hypothetical protein
MSLGVGCCFIVVLVSAAAVAGSFEVDRNRCSSPTRREGATRRAARSAHAFLLSGRQHRTCPVKTLVWRVPVAITNDANALGEIKIQGSVSAG